MAKKEPEKKALKAIDKAVRKATKRGISGGLIDQTVAKSIHSATVKAARKAAVPKKEVAKGEDPSPQRKLQRQRKELNRPRTEDRMLTG
jgi:hypothetical protein